MEKQQKQDDLQKDEQKGEEKQEKKQKKDEQETKEESRIEVPAKFKKIIEEIEKMNIVDLSELVKILEKRFGVSAQPQVVAGIVPAGGAAASAPAGEAAAGEKTNFNVILQAIGDKKIDVIKLVRDITQKGLKESKDLIDAVEKEPQTIKENVKKEEAEELKKKFEESGAKIELK